jgi:hypothetical protein
VGKLRSEFKGASFVWTGGTLNDVKTGKSLITAGITQCVGPGGKGSTHVTGGDSYIKTGSSIDELLPSLANGTVVLYRRKTDTTKRISVVFQAGIGNSDRFLVHLPYSDGNVYIDFGNNSTHRLVIGGLTFTTLPECWVFCISDSRGTECWRNGILLGTKAPPGNRLANTTEFLLGGINNSLVYTDNVENYLFATFPRPFSYHQCQQISLSPWSLFNGEQKRIFTSIVGGTPTYTSTGRLGQTAQGTAAKTAIISLLANAGSSGQSASTKITSQVITGKIGQTAQATSTKVASQAITGIIGQAAQAASTKIASQAITGIIGQAAQAASTKIASQAITGIIGQAGQITAEQIGAGIITTTVTCRLGQAAQAASTKIASQAITGKSGQAAQSASTKIASQAITGKIGQAAQSAHTKIASQAITGIIGQAGRTIAAPGAILIPSIDRGYVVSTENRNYLVSPENRNYSISL